MSQVFFIWDIFDCPTVVLKHLKLFKPYKKLSSQVILREQVYSKKQVCNSKLRVATLMSNKPNSIRMKYLNVWTSCQEWDSLLGQGSASVVDQECRLSQGWEFSWVPLSELLWWDNNLANFWFRNSISWCVLLRKMYKLTDRKFTKSYPVATFSSTTEQLATVTWWVVVSLKGRSVGSSAWLSY